MLLCTYAGWSINSNLFRKQNPDQFCTFIWNYDLLASNSYLYDLLASNSCLLRQVCDVISHQHATSRDVSNGTIVVKHFSCVILSELKIFARCKKHILYCSSMYLYLMETDLYAILLVSKLLKCTNFSSFLIFWWMSKLMSIFLIDKKCPVKYIWSFETLLFILYETLCPISSLHGPILAYYE